MGRGHGLQGLRALTLKDALIGEIRSVARNETILQLTIA